MQVESEESMEKYLKLSFDDKKGANCVHCMISFSKGEKYHCAGLGNRPICPEEGNRKDCPLLDDTDGQKE